MILVQRENLSAPSVQTLHSHHHCQHTGSPLPPSSLAKPLTPMLGKILKSWGLILLVGRKQRQLVSERSAG